MNDDRHSVSSNGTSGIMVDDFDPKMVSPPQTEGSLALDPRYGQSTDHPTCGTPPECLPVTPANGCITSLIDFPALNEKRKGTGKSYQSIADALDMSKATVSRFFCGQSPNPSLYNTIRIFAFLGLSIDEAAGIAKPVPQVETSHDLLRKVEHLEYVAEVKDKHTADLQAQLADAIAMRDRYKAHFTAEIDRARTHYEAEIDKVRARAENQFRLMFTLVVILLAVLLAYVLTDLFLPDRGLFQYRGIFG